ncbi:MAG: c-type cytochrome [Campylobacterota bacterium]
MKKIVIVSVLIAAVMMGGVFYYVRDIIGDDMVNQLTIAAAIILLILVIGVTLKYINQIKNDTASGELADEEWDGIGEYKNELPIGWALSFLGTMIWAAWYWTTGYPLWAYSQIGEWNEEVQAHRAAYETKWEDAGKSELEDMGQSVYLVQCAPCHGITGDGMGGKAANLMERISKESVLHNIKNGANNLTSAYPGGMPAQSGLYNSNSGAMVTDAEAEQVAGYVARGMSGSGADVYQGACASCHGADGTGITGAGPNLVEFDNDLMSALLQDGKKGAIGAMPSFGERLTPVQVKALTTYINSLQM